eukprot:5690053-Prymnesium_polylepis.1
METAASSVESQLSERAPLSTSLISQLGSASSSLTEQQLVQLCQAAVQDAIRTGAADPARAIADALLASSARAKAAEPPTFTFFKFPVAPENGARAHVHLHLRVGVGEDTARSSDFLSRGSDRPAAQSSTTRSTHSRW